MSNSLLRSARGWAAGVLVALIAGSGAIAAPAAAQVDEKPYFEGKKLAWTYVSLTQPRRSYWNSAEDAPVGLGTKPVGLFRSFFRIDTSQVRGKDILDATLATFQNSGQCQPGVELWITGEITQQTTWQRQPSWNKKLGVTGQENCSGPNRVSWAVSGAVAEAAARGDQYVTFGLRSADETNIRGRSVFESDYYVWDHLARYSPTLNITYNTPPETPAPTAVTFGAGCMAFPEPYPPSDYIATTTPTLTAKLTDSDQLQTSPQPVSGRFEWRALGGDKLGEELSRPGYSGEWACAHVPEGQLADGGTYEWRVRAEDGIATSEWTAWQKFTVDTTRPDREPGVTSAEYPEGEFSGGVGVQGTFSFTPEGVTDIVAYQYGFTGSPHGGPVPAGSDGSLTITFTPDRSGPFTLDVVSIDRAGNRSPERSYLFFVSS